MKSLWVLLLPSLLFAKPKGGEVAYGTASCKSIDSTLQIQTSHKAIIQWDEFSIAKGETTRFIQPGRDSAVLNRILGGVSQIDGLLQANGRVYLVNPQGIVIGKDGCINAAGFIASTLDLDNDHFFKNQELLFKGNSDGKIVNFGKVEALGGDVFLFGKSVINQGSLVAKDGIVGIGAGEEILLMPSGSQRLFISLKKDSEKSDGGIENRGMIEATQAELRADGNIYRFAINQSGVIEATAMEEREGRMFLVANKGTTLHTGSIDPSASDGTLGKLLFTRLTEQWKGYFSSDSGGVPYTIFYKIGLPTNTYNLATRVFGEMFQNLRTYDELLFSTKCFLLGYDKACYDREFYPKGMISSFDLYGEETYEMLIQKYRNYHTKYVESF